MRDKQITVTWHVDYLKVSHSDKNIIGSFIQWTNDTYEDVTNIDPPRVSIHDYPSMTLDYTTSVRVKICMKEYIDKIIEEFPYMEEVNHMKKCEKTPTPEYLIVVNKNTTNMDADKLNVFHTTIAKSLFL